MDPSSCRAAPRPDAPGRGRRGSRPLRRRGVIQDARAFPNGSGFLDPDLRDVGQIAQGVLRDIDDAAAKDAARQVLQALQGSIVAASRKKDHKGVSHMTVQGPEAFLRSRDYARETGFREWGSLLHDIRPWYSRMLSA